MTRRESLILAVVALGVALAVTVSASRLAKANGAVSAAAIGFVTSLNDAQEILDLRSRQQVINATQRPPQDVIALVNGVLANTGIPSGRLKSLAPESDAMLNSAAASGSNRYRKQSLRLTLENLSVKEIGAFLIQWKSSQIIWTPERIELAHVRSQNPTDDRYDTSILLSAIYVAQE